MSEVEQGSEAWFQQRCGKATASRISDIVAKTKTGYSTSRVNYMAQLVVERMTNQVRRVLLKCRYGVGRGE
jgi:hypothetical protein